MATAIDAAGDWPSVPMDTIDDDGQALGRFFDADEDVGLASAAVAKEPVKTAQMSRITVAEIAHQDLLGPAFSHLQLTMPYRQGHFRKVLATGALETHGIHLDSFRLSRPASRGRNRAGRLRLA
jgi:hypothetical protein